MGYGEAGEIGAHAIQDKIPWGDGYYVGTAGDGVTEESIRSYIEKQGKEDGHKAFEQMRLFNL